MTIRKLLVVAALTGFAVFGFTSCKDRTSQAGNDSKPMGKPEVAVETLTTAYSDIADSVDVVGNLSPKVLSDVRAEYFGVVREVHVTEWVRVKKGQPLFTLDTREPQAMLDKARDAAAMAKADLLQADVAVKRAEREYSRILQLKESGLATSQSVDEAGTEKDAAIARKSSAEARLGTARQDFEQAKLRFAKNVVTSPIDGVVAERRINAGDYAGDKPVFRIVDNRLLDLTVTVPSQYIEKLRTGQELQFETDAFPGRTFTGHVKYINPVVNEGDRSVKVIAEVSNPDEALKGGLFVKGRIVTGHRGNVIQVPRNALVNWDVQKNKAEVLVASNGSAHKKIVGTGTIQSDKVEIVTGLVPGDKVILRGGFNIKEGDKVKTDGGK